MKSLKIAAAILLLTPTLAFAGNNGWGRQHRHQARQHAHHGQRYCAPAPVLYHAPRQHRPLRHRHIHRSANAVHVGLAAGLVTGLVVASMVHGR